MLAYKALYRKMMDDLKDAGMWLDWAEQICESHPDEARFLLESAKERLEESFPKTYEHFEKLCEASHGKGDICMNEVVHDHMMEWHHAMHMKAEKMLKK
jgi:hypothetical protein